MIADEASEITRFGGKSEADRPLGRSIRRGLLNRCPACGSGTLFRTFLKPVDHCAACNEDLHHQRADDLPPYLVIFVLGHIMVGGFLMSDEFFPQISMWWNLAIWVPLTTIAALLLIQPMKGGVIGLQWALKMHGFGGPDNEPDHGQNADHDA